MGKGAFIARSDSLRGTRIGGYEIVRLIGHGATASVFEAMHVGLGRAVAMKLLHEHLGDDEQVRDRFLREGRVAARLRHPNTVVVLDVGDDNGVPYLVMELLQGGDLRALLAENPILTVDHALSLLLPIASALAQAHDTGVIHRDVKPANIFLARDVRNDVVPKLVDFGLSKVADGEASASLTATEMVAGTVQYMAPEQTVAVRNASPASDQYSLASILYQAITGQPPFTGDGVYALIDRIRNELARPPSHIHGRVPEDLDDVILRALHRDPAKRFPGIRAFGRALLPFAGEPTATSFERDFTERVKPSIPAAASPSRPSMRRVATAQAPPAPLSSRPSMKRAAAAEAETRIESSSPPKSTPTPRAPTNDPSASSIRRNTPLPCPPGESPFLIKGMPYRGFVFLVNKSLPGGLDAFTTALEDQRLVPFVRQPFLATGRYDVFPFLPLFVTLARLLKTPFEPLVRSASTAQARYDAQTAYQRILTGKSPTDLGDRIARFGAQYYSYGKVSATNAGPGVTVLVHEGVPAYVYPWYAPMHAAYTEEVARMFGATEATSEASEAVQDGKSGPYPLVRARTEIHWKV